MLKTTRNIACNCKHEFQDKLYGIGRRLANLVNKSVKSASNNVDYRCTVCGKSHTVNK